MTADELKVEKIESEVQEEIDAYNAYSDEAEQADAMSRAGHDSRNITLRKSEMDAMFTQLKSDPALDKKKNYFLLCNIVYELLYRDVSKSYCLFYLFCKELNSYKKIESTGINNILRNINRSKGIEAPDKIKDKDIEYDCFVTDIRNEDYLLFAFARECKKVGVSILDIQSDVEKDFKNNMKLEDAIEKYLRRNVQLRLTINKAEEKKINENFVKFKAINNNNSIKIGINDYIRDTIMYPPIFSDVAVQLRAYNLTSINLSNTLKEALQTLSKTEDAGATLKALQKLDNTIAYTQDTMQYLAKMSNDALSKQQSEIIDEPM